MKKKILVIGPGMEVGGVERSLIGLLNAFDYEEYDVDLFLMSHTGEFMPYIHSKVNILPINKLYHLSAMPIAQLYKKRHFFVGTVRLWAKIYAWIRAKLKKNGNVNTTYSKKILTFFSKKLKEEYDIALGFFSPHYFLNKKVSAKVKIGWVHTDYSNANEAQDKKFLFSMWNGLDFIACVSDSVRTSFEKIYPELSSKTIVVENILSTHFVREQAMLEDISFFDNSKFNIVSVGRYCTAKAFDEAILACKVLKEKALDFVWYFIGYGPDEEKLKSIIVEHSLQDTAILLGKKINPYPYMQGCDLYVQPSRYEGKAVTVREAQMLGKPVLITNFVTAKSQVENGVDGFICSCGIQGIVEGIEYLYHHAEIRNELAQNAQAREYGNIDEIEKIYKYMEKEYA